jgi:hypothetical protein
MLGHGSLHCEVEVAYHTRACPVPTGVGDVQTKGYLNNQGHVSNALPASSATRRPMQLRARLSGVVSLLLAA